MEYQCFIKLSLANRNQIALGTQSCMFITKQSMDVTLAYEDKLQAEAHKVIMSMNSTKFLIEARR